VTEHVERFGGLGRVAPLRVGTAFAWARRHAWIAAWWAGSRALVLAIALLVHATGRPSGYLRTDLSAHTLGLLDSWDGRWYGMVAAHGYLLVDGRQSDPAFFPFFPLLLRAAHAFGIGYSNAGVLIANVALLGALAAFYGLTKALLGEGMARRATIYVAIFPLGYVFSMAYPESVVLMLIAVAVLAALRRRWLLAAVCAGCAALTRPEGIFVALPLLAIAWQAGADSTPLRRGLALGAVLAPAAALASYPFYLDRVLDDPLAWTQAEHAWGRHFSPLGFVHAFGSLPSEIAQSAWVVRDVAFLLVYLGLLVVARRAGTPWPWIAAALAIVVLPVFSGSFTSIGRFGLLAPPVFWGLAALGRDRRADLAIRAVSVALLVAATVTVPYVFP
jgi:hypothetical protein